MCHRSGIFSAVFIIKDLSAHLKDSNCCVSGVAFYNVFLRSVAIKKVFFWSAMVLIAVHAAQVVLVTGTMLSGHNLSLSVKIDIEVHRHRLSLV